MPYKVFKNGPVATPYCVFTLDADGKPTGEAHGCHPTRKAALAQAAALYVHAPEATQADKKAQQKRSQKYDIGIKAGGNVTKPEAYADVSEDMFADPVNYRYPLSPAMRAVNAITRFNDTSNKAAGGYTDAEWAKIGERIAKANKGKIYKGGQVVDKKTEAKLDGEGSISDFTESVRAAFRVAYDHQRPDGSWPDTHLSDIYENDVVACVEGVWYRIPFEHNTEGQIVFAGSDKWVKVEKAYTPITEGFRFSAAKKKDKPEGKEWEIVIIGPGQSSDLITEGGKTYIKSQNGRLYSTAALEASVPLWDGIKVYDNHLTDAEFKDKQGMRSVVQEWVGVIVEPFWDKAAHAIKGLLKVVDDGLRAKLLNAEEASVLDKIGLSIDAFVDTAKATVKGEVTEVITKVVQALSVDVVADPAAGGKLARVIAGLPSNNKEKIKMTPEELKELIEGILAEKFGTFETSLAAKVDTMVKEAIAKLDAGDEGGEPEEDPKKLKDDDKLPVAVQKIVDQALQKAETMVTEARNEAKLAKCANVLVQKLSDSGLPETIRALVEKRFTGTVFEEKDLDAAIKEHREALIPLEQSGRVVMPAGSHVSVSPITELDRYELGFLRLIAGNTQFDKLMDKELAKKHSFEAIARYVEAGKPSLPRSVRLSEWYYDFTGGDYDGLGVMYNKRLKEANVTLANLSSIVKNAVNILLAADYSVRQQWWAPIVREEDVDTLDQATLVRVYGLSNLATVAESAEYNELAWADEEETATWVKRGNYIGVSLETFLNDKVAKIRTLPSRLSNAWYNTISALVSAVFTVNTAAGPVLGDNGALFNATPVTTAGGHANLLMAALSHAGYTAAKLAMQKQTDQPLGAGVKLNIQPKYLVVPVDLVPTANQIRNSDLVPIIADSQINQQAMNDLKGQFEIVVNPVFTDTNDWALVADPQQWPAIWLIWLRGRRTPEIFTADDEKSGSMFTNDEMRFKVRQYGFRFSATYDAAPVSDFRPLHKSNV